MCKLYAYMYDVMWGSWPILVGIESTRIGRVGMGDVIKFPAKLNLANINKILR